MAVQACSVIIISYNSGGFLPPCLHSIFRALEGIEHQVIVLDNGSPEPLPQALLREYSQVEWIHSDRNLGFGSACNRAAKQARHPLLFFVNPDTLVSRDTFRSLLQYIEKKDDAGVVGCRILNGDGSLQWACRRSFPSPMAAIYKTLGLASLFPKSRIFGAYNLTYLDPDSEEEVDAVSGSFFCVRATVYEQVGGFDEDFFLYGEDLDICYRVQQAGFHNYYYPGTSIIHFKGQSSKTRIVRSYVDFYQAMLIFARKHPNFLQPVPLWMISMGVFFAAALGIFSRLMPEWGRLAIDLLLLLGIWLGTSMLPVAAMDWQAVAVLAAVTLVPFLFLGEYGTGSLESGTMFRKIVPLQIIGVGAWVLVRGASPLLFGLAIAALVGMWLWRRLLYWFQYFQGVFSGKRRRSVLLGSHESIGQWFIRENLLPGRDILGCVSALGKAESRAHYLGSLADLPRIRQRTGLRELLVVPDSVGRHEEVPELLPGAVRMDTWLLIGHPDSSTFAMVDLHFLK